MSEDWQAAYPVGCRVEVDVEAYQALLGRKTRLRLPYTGTVLGYSWAYYGDLLRVYLDGRKGLAGEHYPAACVRRLAEPEEEA